VHLPAGAREALAPWKFCKVLCALVITAKRSIDELFMHYFHYFPSALGGFAPRPHKGSTLDPTGELWSPDPHFAHPWKKILRVPMFEANLLKKRCIKFHQNRLSFIGDITNKIFWSLFFLDTV